MTRTEIIDDFRQENPEITDRVLTDIVLGTWLKEGNKYVATRARVIVTDETFNSVIDQPRYDLTTEIENFFDVDEYPGGGVSYDDNRLDPTTIADLDRRTRSWRTASSGTPRKYYRRGQYLNLDRAPDAIEEIQVFAVLTPDDFDNDEEEPFNQLTYLRPFHYSLMIYLTARAMQKVGKETEAKLAKQDLQEYIAWMKKEIAGGKFGPIQMRPQNRL